jgi:hypothetical protein
MAIDIATARSEVAKIYIAAFNRVPDSAGLAFWVSAYMNGSTLASIADGFASSQEYANTYPAYLTNTEYVQNIYTNVFGRTADAAGLAFWSDAITNGVVTKAALLNSMITAAGGTGNNDGLKLANQATFAVQSVLDEVPTATATAQLANITYDTATITTATTAVSGTTNVGLAYTLTAAANVLTGTANNDTFNGSDTTSVLGSVNGSTGTDTFNYVDATGGEDVIADTGLILTSIETLNIRSLGAADATTTSVTGLNNLNVTQGTASTVDAAATTAVSVTGVTGAVAIDGGSTQTVTTAGTGVTLGATTGAAGAISVTHTAQAATAIAIDGGTSVTVTASGVTTGTVDIGQSPVAASPIPTAAVNVTSTGNAYTAATVANVLGAITIDGGTTVTVNQTAYSSTTAAATDTDTTNGGGADFTRTQSAITVNGSDLTTSVTVNQTAAVTAVDAVIAVAAAYETEVVTFGALTAGQTTTVDGLTFTATAAMTAAQVAAAFANLSASDKHGSSTLGVYTGNTTANWTSGAVSGATVTFTEVVASTANTALVLTAGDVDPTSVTTAGVTAVTGVTGVAGIVGGAVVVDDAGTGTDSIASVTLSGYGASSTVNSNALTTLNLANSAQDVDVTNTTVAATLALALNNVTGAITLAANADYTTLNITTSGADSATALTTDATALTVAGTNLVNLSTGTAAALTTVTVSGTAGLTMDGDEADTITSVTTTATTGTTTITIGGDTATYTGGAGVDNVTLDATTVNKAINLGAGNDSLTLATGTVALTTEMIAGDGTDTLVMAAADAESVAGATTFETKITSFEKLSLGAVLTTADNTVDLANMDDISYVISANTVDTAQVSTITFSGTETDAANEILTTTITDATGTATFTTTVQASAAATAAGTVVSAVTYNVTGTSKQTYTVTEAAGVVTITGGTAGTTFTATTVSTTPGATTDITAGALVVTSSELFLTNMTNNGTVELSAAGLGATVTMTDATSLTADSLNVILTNNATSAFGTVAAAGVETVNITATDVFVDAAGDGIDDSIVTAHTMTLSDAAVKTINLTGNAGLTLTNTNNVALTLLDASTGYTGVLTASTNGTVAETIKGGSAADVLTAATSNLADTLIGNGGNDTLNANAGLTQMTGGAGNDTFVIAVASLNSSSYSTITDATAGDAIIFTGADSFAASAVTQGDTAVFQDYCNAAINAIGANDVAWFQYANNTYMVMDSTDTATFTNSQDFVVKLTGLVDLSTATFNATNSSIELH